MMDGQWIPGQGLAGSGGGGNWDLSPPGAQCLTACVHPSTGSSYSKPSISLSPSGEIAPGTDVSISCHGPRQGVRFKMYRSGVARWHMEPAGSTAEFAIPNIRREDGGTYTCSYESLTEPPVSSPHSDPVQLVVAGGTNPTQPGAAPAPTRPGSTGPTPGLTSPIIAGASAAAAGLLLLLLLLLLLVAFVCFRKTRARKGAAPRPSSTIPLGVLKALAQQDPIYSPIDEGKERQTLPQEPDPGTDGLTYAELDIQALHAKRRGPDPAPEPTQPSVYAVINVSRGALQ
ncbi:immunoglobulin superfamily member 1-like [Dermochelys coriacea]|uniref:immunoglobulin superfamily member 1-like n=1 Tax=Dermochelys coriacea TaxID=27794 RepID=UPI001CA87BF3|nr:immunoglobulin superfamily member 1-like [Dermochelys coriacea]